MAGAILAFSGKGGSGKTTLATLVLRQLQRRGIKPVLAVDADPNATLGLMLGQQVPGTIADLRERMQQAAQEVSEIPKERLLGQWLGQLLGEAAGFDLLAMGRPEGPGCYCYVNALLRRYLKELRGSYAAVVVDCQAGMEYLSRLTVDDVETLVLVAEPTHVGLASAARIARLADALPVRVRRRVLAINKVGQSGPPAEEAPGPAEMPEVQAVVRLPFVREISRRCALGQPLDEQAAGAARAAIEELTDACLGLCGGRQAAPRQRELTS